MCTSVSALVFYMELVNFNLPFLSAPSTAAAACFLTVPFTPVYCTYVCVHRILHVRARETFMYCGTPQIPHTHTTTIT